MRNGQSKPLVSIIIVNWNGKKWLKNFLKSLKNQNFQDFETIVVDNGSTDGSQQFIKKYYPNATFIQSKRNLGFAGGNNLGIKHASGKLILLINNDTWVNKNFVGNFIKFYLDNNYDVVGARETSYNKPYANQNFLWTIDVLGHPVKHPSKQFYICGVCLLFSKELYQQTGGLDDDFFMYFEETDWFWRLNLLGKTFAYVPSLYVHHAGSGSTGSGIKYNSFLWRNQNTLQMLLKNYSWLMLTIVLPLYFLQNIVEILFFIILGKFNIAKSYIEGWIFNLRHLRRTLKKRKTIQSQRKVSDFHIVFKMSFLPGKLIHLLEFYKNKD